MKLKLALVVLLVIAALVVSGCCCCCAWPSHRGYRIPYSYDSGYGCHSKATFTPTATATPATSPTR